MRKVDVWPSGAAPFALCVKYSCKMLMLCASRGRRETCLASRVEVGSRLDYLYWTRCGRHGDHSDDFCVLKSLCDFGDMTHDHSHARRRSSDHPQTTLTRHGKGQRARGSSRLPK